MLVCRLVLVFLSLFGMWWLVNNIMLLPVIYIYFDVMLPVLYLLVLLLFVHVFFFCYGLEFKYKFLVDYAAKNSNFMIFFDKCFDLRRNFFFNTVFGFFSGGGLVMSVFFKNLSINIMVVMLVLFFFFF